MTLMEGGRGGKQWKRDFTGQNYEHDLHDSNYKTCLMCEKFSSFPLLSSEHYSLGAFYTLIFVLGGHVLSFEREITCSALALGAWYV